MKGNHHLPIAVVTGASSGIGAATARQLGRQGFHVVLGARRLPLVEQIAREIDAESTADDREGHATALSLDVTDAGSAEAFVEAVTGYGAPVRVLVNNAGGARGLAPVAEADEDHWRWMWETNVIGTLRVTRGLLPALIASGDGHIVTVTSIAAIEPYDNGGRLHLGQARPGGAAPDAARGAARAAGAADRGRSGDGGDRVLPGPLRR